MNKDAPTPIPTPIPVKLPAKRKPKAKKPKELAPVQDGPIVAIQYPSTVEYSDDSASVTAMAEKYKHLKQLNVDDKEGYKELTTAIADVRTRRTDIVKQENVIKDPLNAFKDMVIKKSKEVRGLILVIEDALKAEKERIDDIRKERKLAQQKLWQDNLNIVRSMTDGMQELGIIPLIGLLDKLNSFDFKSMDFGDYIEQAKTTVSVASSAVSERIEFLKEQERLAEERAEHERQVAAEEKSRAEEKAEREAEAESARVKQAEADEENRKLREKMAAMQAQIDANNAPKEVEPKAGRAAAVADDPESTVERTESTPEQDAAEIITDVDSDAMKSWATDILMLSSKAPFVLREKSQNAVDAVSDQLIEIVEYLNKVAGE